MGGKKGGRWSGTFQWWDEFPPGEVKKIKKEDMGGYQSTYVFQFNILKEVGWEFKNKKWYSPVGDRSFEKIGDAYSYQVNFLDKMKRS